MFKLLKKKIRFTKNQKGMTLIELMATVVIMGILASVAGVAVTNSFSTSKTNTDTTSEKILIDAAQRYYIDNGTTPTLADLSPNYITEVPTPANGSAFTLTSTVSGVFTVGITP